jgi:hypothetical protein
MITLKNIKEPPLDELCYAAVDAIDNVMSAISCNEQQREFYDNLQFIRDMLELGAIPAGEFISEAKLQCRIAEAYDNDDTEDAVFGSTRELIVVYKIVFDILHSMGINAINENVLNEFTDSSFVYYGKLPCIDTCSHNELVNFYKTEIEKLLKIRPDYFRKGQPDSEPFCTKQCRRGISKCALREYL